MLRRIRLLDLLGWFVEKMMIWIICSIFTLVFLVNEIFLFFMEFNNKMSEEIHVFMLEMYDVLIISPNNIGTITTIAAVLLGIYVTVLSVFGSLKINSMIAFLDSHDIKRLIKYIRSAMVAAFIMIFYSFLLPALPNEFTRAFFTFLFLIYMLLTALRFGLVILAIYSHDLNKLINNLSNEKEDTNKQKHIMFQLGEYLELREKEDLLKRANTMANVLEMEKKQDN
jgi:hypothetical protein